jgi:hypothetical protein
MKEMVLPEDETKIYNKTLATRLKDTNQQIKKWINRWKPVVETQHETSERAGKGE